MLCIKSDIDWITRKTKQVEKKTLSQGGFSVIIHNNLIALRVSHMTIRFSTQTESMSHPKTNLEEMDQRLNIEEERHFEAAIALGDETHLKTLTKENFIPNAYHIKRAILHGHTHLLRFF